MGLAPLNITALPGLPSSIPIEFGPAGIVVDPTNIVGTDVYFAYTVPRVDVKSCDHILFFRVPDLSMKAEPEILSYDEVKQLGMRICLVNEMPDLPPPDYVRHHGLIRCVEHEVEDSWMGTVDLMVQDVIYKHGQYIYKIVFQLVGCEDESEFCMVRDDAISALKDFPGDFLRRLSVLRVFFPCPYRVNEFGLYDVKDRIAEVYGFEMYDMTDNSIGQVLNHELAGHGMTLLWKADAEAEIFLDSYLEAAVAIAMKIGGQKADAFYVKEEQDEAVERIAYAAELYMNPQKKALILNADPYIIGALKYAYNQMLDLIAKKKVPISQKIRIKK